MTEPTNEELAEALRSIEDLPLGTQLIVRLAADRLCADEDLRIKWCAPVEPSGEVTILVEKGGRIIMRGSSSA